MTKKTGLSVAGGLLVGCLALTLSSAPASAERSAAASYGSPAATGGTAGEVVHVLTCTDRRATRPADYVISCADANAQWKDVHWMSWGRHTASGRGDYYVNDCTPYCAAGKFHTYRAAIRLSAVRSTAKYGPLFSQATVSYTVDGRTKTQGYDLID